MANMGTVGKRSRCTKESELSMSFWFVVSREIVQHARTCSAYANIYIYIYSRELIKTNKVHRTI
jgi:hypothetical protein